MKSMRQGDRDRFVPNEPDEREDPMDESYAEMHTPPVATCPECSEHLWVELTEFDMCDPCLDDKVDKELALVQKSPGESISSYVARKNDVLREHNMNADFQWCSFCQDVRTFYETHESELKCFMCSNGRYPVPK